MEPAFANNFTDVGLYCPLLPLCCALGSVIQTRLHRTVLAPHLLITLRAGLNKPPRSFLLIEAILLSLGICYSFDNLFDVKGIFRVLCHIFIQTTSNVFTDGRDRTQSRNPPNQGTYILCRCSNKAVKPVTFRLASCSLRFSLVQAT